MIRNLIATSAAMLFVMGGATFPEEAHGSPVDTSTDPSIVRATVRAPYRRDAAHRVHLCFIPCGRYASGHR